MEIANAFVLPSLIFLYTKLQENTNETQHSLIKCTQQNLNHDNENRGRNSPAGVAPQYTPPTAGQTYLGIPRLQKGKQPNYNIDKNFDILLKNDCQKVTPPIKMKINNKTRHNSPYLYQGGHWGFAESGNGIFWVRKSIMVSAEYSVFIRDPCG